jgi:hypothetical protein
MDDLLAKQIHKISSSSAFGWYCRKKLIKTLSYCSQDHALNAIVPQWWIKLKSKCGKVPESVELELGSPWKLLEKEVQTNSNMDMKRGQIFRFPYLTHIL